MKPKTLILRTSGSNCDEETAFAFELAGATSHRVHLNRILENPAVLADYQLLAIPGGFSYGDDIAAGRIFANQIAHHLRDVVGQFIDDGKPVIGICNGFQVLIKTDLLPGRITANGNERAGQSCTLTNNDSGRFIDRWVHLKAVSRKCVWTQGIERLELPIAHGEGKFVPGDESVRRLLHDEDQIVLTYTKADGSPANGVFPDNPNGSIDDIAGICDASGLVLGLMPHPERFVSMLQHPAWGWRMGQGRGGNASSEGAGNKLFSNAVTHAGQAVGRGI